VSLQSISACVQKYRHDVSSAIARKHNPSDDAKKHQQAFLALLPGMDLKTPCLVIALGNDNSHLWHRHTVASDKACKIFL
jgi:hypothetical protein